MRMHVIRRYVTYVFKGHALCVYLPAIRYVSRGEKRHVEEGIMPSKDRATRTFRLQVGAALRRRRLELGLSQEEVAWEADVAQGSISNYEIGRNDIPLTVLLRICHALDLSPVDLIPRLAGEPSDDSPEVAGPVLRWETSLAW